jgi:hypothetical protein
VYVTFQLPQSSSPVVGFCGLQVKLLLTVTPFALVTSRAPVPP